MNRLLLIALATVALMAPAQADDAPGDAPDQARCEQGTAFAKKKDWTRAILYLESCDTKQLRDAKHAADAAGYASLTISSDPVSGVPVTLDSLPGETLTTPVTIYVKPGVQTVRYEVEDKKFSKEQETKKSSSAVVLLDAVPRTAKVKDGHVSFEEEGSAEEHKGPPPDIKHPPIVPKKFLGIPDAPSGPQLDDPLAYHADTRHPWFGFRIGGGVYDDGATSAAWRPTVALTGRFSLAPRWFLSARLDWSRRGGDGAASIDVAGASIGPGIALASTRSIAVAAMAQLRGDLRFSDAMDVRTAGLDVAADLEVAFTNTPLTAGLRAEQGLTELAPGVHDRALLVELGVDWR
ncbi:MAG TPA: hypothetical protein VGM39_05920 [Kofleriaceae bacterium]